MWVKAIANKPSTSNKVVFFFDFVVCLCCGHYDNFPIDKVSNISCNNNLYN